MCNQGLSLQTTYIPRANQEFFSTLFPLAEVTPQCQMDVFVNFDHSVQFHGLAMSLSHGCPMLQLDRLVFMQMDHIVLLVPERDNTLRSCYFQPVPELNIDHPSMVLHSHLKEARIFLGTFIALIQEPDRPAMTTIFSSESSGYRARIHSALVTIMGTVITAPIEIENGMLSLESDTIIYGSYDANLRVTASTGNPWERLVLNVFGRLQDSTNAVLTEFARILIDQSVVRRAAMRRDSANMVVQRNEEQLAVLEEEYNARNETLKNASESYAQALEMADSASVNLAAAEEAFNDASEELRMAELALDSVCNENSCSDISVLVEDCTTCFVNTYMYVAVRCPPVLEDVIPMPCGLVRMQPDRERRVWVYETRCSQGCGFSCFFFCSISCSFGCRGVCVQRIVREPNLVRKCLPAQREVFRPCPRQRIVSDQTPSVCCNNVTMPAEDTQCKEECRNSRMMAIRALQQSRQDLAAPFERLENARASHAAAQSHLSRMALRRDNAREMRDQESQRSEHPEP